MPGVGWAFASVTVAVTQCCVPTVFVSAFGVRTSAAGGPTTVTLIVTAHWAASPVSSVTVKTMTNAEPCWAGVGVKLKVEVCGLAPVRGRPGVIVAPGGRPLVLMVTVWPTSGSAPVTVKDTFWPDDPVYTVVEGLSVQVGGDPTVVTILRMKSTA